MLTLIGECKMTEAIVYETGESPDDIIPNLIRLRHLGIVEPAAFCVEDADNPGVAEYPDNILWTLTEHGREHDTTISGCYGCDIRQRLMLDVVGLVE